MIANIVVDLIIVSILVIGAFIGIKRGFILTLAKPVKWIASVLIALSLCNSVAKCGADTRQKPLSASGFPEAKYEFWGFAIASIRLAEVHCHRQCIHSSPPLHGFFLQVSYLSFYLLR